MRKTISELLKLKIISVAATVLTLSFLTALFTGEQNIDKSSWDRWAGIISIAMLFFFTSFLIDAINSLIKVKRYTDAKTNQVIIKKLWGDCYTNPVAGIIVILVTAFGIANAQDLSELYKNTVTNWNDIHLWEIEKDFFIFLKGSIFNTPIVFDYVYFSLWAYLMLVYSILYKHKRYNCFAIFCIATVISFFLTRIVALKYPTTGPIFYQPHFFNIEGTTSERAQQMLTVYMLGGINQNGFIPGTMGMPSLHIGLSVMATCALSVHAKWTLWLTIPWCCLIWMSTIMLGWHYALDGIGGIIVVFVSVLLALATLKIEEIVFVKLSRNHKEN